MMESVSSALSEFIVDRLTMQGLHEFDLYRPCSSKRYPHLEFTALPSISQITIVRLKYLEVPINFSSLFAVSDTSLTRMPT
jgi:hypothetical protein